jgi:hypothetical protein
MSEGLREPLKRRTFLKRAAIVGTAPVWASPVIQSIRTPAYAASPVGHGFDISFVALLLTCGGTQYRIKWDADGSLSGPECGRNFAAGNCADQLGRHSAAVSLSSCPPGVSASGSSAGVSVNLGSCAVLDYIVKSGQCCAGPGQAGEPALPLSGSASFPQPTSNCSDCVSTPPC